MQSGQQPIMTALTPFQSFVKRHELNPTTAKTLLDVISRCDVVLLCDDSDSMSQSISEEGTDAFAPKKSTRWMELKKFCAALIEIVTSTHPFGLDIHFLNRPPVRQVMSPQGLSGVFSIPPNGATPLTDALSRIFRERAVSAQAGPVLVIVVTDGEPTSNMTTDVRGELFSLLSGKHNNIHVSFAECTDQEEDMEYLDQWDGQIPNFDNTDDYREELQRVKNAQGMQFKFDYTDYCIKVILSTFVRWFFSLDQANYAGRAASTSGSQDITHFPARNVPPHVVPVGGFPQMPQYSAQANASVPASSAIEAVPIGDINLLQSGVWIHKPGHKSRTGNHLFEGHTWHRRHLFTLGGQLAFGEKEHTPLHQIPWNIIEAVRIVSPADIVAEKCPSEYINFGFVIVTNSHLFYMATEMPGEREAFIQALVQRIEGFDPRSPFGQLVKRHELRMDIAHDLYHTLATTEICVVCDDSGSMGTAIMEPATITAPARQTTRWLELKKLTSIILEFTLAVNSNGVDLYFLNRGHYPNIRSLDGIGQLFANGPSGFTPLSETVVQLLSNKQSTTRQQPLLVVIISDGEPSDSHYGYSSAIERFKAELLRKGPHVYVSLAECTDNEEDMDYLDGWDNAIPNFDNTDDYREDLNRVKKVMGQNFKFDYADYVVKILLSPFFGKYKLLDQGQDVSCCSVM